MEYCICCDLMKHWTISARVYLMFLNLLSTCLQKAMDLYKKQNSKRISSIKPNEEHLHSHSAPQVEVEQCSDVKEETDSPVDCSVKKEEPTMLFPEGSITPVMEGKEAAFITSDKALDGGPLQSTELALGLKDQEINPTFKAETKDENINLAESTFSNAIKTTLGEVGSDGMCGATPDEPLNCGVSDALVLSHDSVKVREGFNFVSNESDSVGLSRIHHAPESTH